MCLWSMIHVWLLLKLPNFCALYIVNLFYILLCFFANYCNFSCEWRKTDSKNPNFQLPVVLYTLLTLYTYTSQAFTP